MKHFFTFWTLMLFAFALNAQYIYNDFDENQNETFNGWPNMPTIVANPDASGINTSANVAEWVRSTEQWAHVYCELPGKIDFSTGTVFNVKLHTPIACTVLFKLEDKNDGNISTELSTDVNDVNTWVQLGFDFTDGESDKYDKITIFFDFSSTTDNTFYFDDVTGPEYGSGGGEKPLLALDVQDNFEDDGWGTITTWKFQDPDLVDLPVVEDPVNSGNHVAEYNRSGNFEYTNAQFVLDHRMDLSERNMFDLKVYFPSTNDYSGDLTPTAAIKLQNSLLGGNAWTTQTEVKLTVEDFDTWVTLTFDFSMAADSVNYDQVVVQLGGEGHFVPAMFYFDDIELLNPLGVENEKVLATDVYPNPATSMLYLEDGLRLKSIRIVSMNGQVVYQSDKVNNSIDVSSFTGGVYTLLGNGIDGNRYQAKFIVK